MDIKQLLTTSEGKTLEFKRDTSALKQIMKTIVAFANTAGGVIVIGREDDGNIAGVENPLQVEEQLSSAIADSIAPMIMPDIEIVSVAGKALLCICVAHWPGPFYLKSEGDERGVYIRLGSSTRQAGPEFIAEMKRQHENKTFDQLPCPSLSIEALDLPFIEKIFKEAGREVHEQQLISLGILTPFAGRNVVTYGGLILFGKPDIRQQILPDARVSCARFSGTDKAHFLDRLDFEGSILEAIEKVPTFILRNSRLFPKIEGMKREDIPAYPGFAVREILVNSVVHCDYSLTGMRVMVAIFSDRLEIQSPGLLPFGMTMDDLKTGLSRIRNRVVARTLKELGVMEEWGSGYKRVVDFCNANGYPAPEWQEIGPTIRVIVYPHPEAKELTPHVTPSATPSVTPSVVRLLATCEKALSRKEIQSSMGIKNKKYFLENYLQPALTKALLEMTIPDKPNSPLQQYQLTQLGRQWLAEQKNRE